MKWVEIIMVRSAESRPDAIYRTVKGIASEELDEAMKENIKLYQRSGIESDISVHIQHDSDRSGIRKSTYGQQLAEALKMCGLVNHAIWVEENKNEPEMNE